VRARSKGGEATRMILMYHWILGLEVIYATGWEAFRLLMVSCYMVSKAASRVENNDLVWVGAFCFFNWM
jgi:uncharacterized membrane protein